MISKQQISTEEKDKILWFINIGRPLISLINSQTYTTELFTSLAPTIEFSQKLAKEVAEISQQFNSALNRYHILSDGFYKSVVDSVEMISNFKAAYQDLIMRMNKSFEVLSETARTLHESAKLEKEVLRDSGWVFSPSLGEVPAHWIIAAIQRYKSGDKNSIRRLMFRIYHRGNFNYLKEVVSGWSMNPLFKPRMKIINDALRAHCRGEYTLSIPALLPLIEGIATEYCKRNSIKASGEYAIKEAVKHQLIKIPKGIVIYEPEVLIYNVENSTFVGTEVLKRRPNKKILNRHGILHGLYKNYADASRSLRCFLILDALSVLGGRNKK